MEKRKVPKFKTINANMSDEEMEKAVEETLYAIQKNGDDLATLEKQYLETVNDFNELIKPSGKRIDTIDHSKVDAYVNEHYSESKQIAGNVFVKELEMQPERERRKGKPKGNIKSAVSGSRIKI